MRQYDDVDPTDAQLAAEYVYQARAYLLRTLDPLSHDYVAKVDWRSRLEASDLLLDILRTMED